MVHPCIYLAAARRLQRAAIVVGNRAAAASLSRSRIRPLSTAVSAESWHNSQDFQSYTKPQLKDRCRSLGLPVSGNKSELLDRLCADIDKDGDTDTDANVNDNVSTSNTSAALALGEGEVSTDAVAVTTLPAVTVPTVAPVDQKRSEGFCFDRASNYKLVPVFLLEQEGRMERDAVLSPAMTVQDETSTLLGLLPDELAISLEDLGVRSQLMEVVLDVGRRPFAWVDGKRLFLLDNCDYRLTQEQLELVLSNLHFGGDNRAGINGSLHRISAIRNREGLAVGATLRVGRYVPGNAIMIADILLGSNCSILFVGPPGSAKTSIIRDAARLLADDHSVVIVDTSSEIGGAGDIPHECIGLSRRMQVKHIDVQAAVMVECVQNHTPSVMVIDEIGRPAEVAAALTCKERGVRIIASAHGNMPGLVRNATLCDLIGGVDVVTVGDARARKDAQYGRSPSKLRAERKGPPIFDVIVELKRGHLHEWQIVLNTAAAVDSILSSGHYEAQIRTRTATGSACALHIRNVKLDASSDKIIKAALLMDMYSRDTALPSSEVDKLSESDVGEYWDSDADQFVGSDAEQYSDSDAEQYSDSDAEQYSDSDAEQSSDSDAEQYADSDAEQYSDSDGEQSSISDSDEQSGSYVDDLSGGDKYFTERSLEWDAWDSDFETEENAPDAKKKIGKKKYEAWNVAGDNRGAHPLDNPMHKKCRKCPICSKVLANHKGMMTHALSKESCAAKLPAPLMEHFQLKLL